MTKHGHHNPPFPLDVTTPEPTQLANLDINPEILLAEQVGIFVSKEKSDPPLVVGNIDMCKLRDLLFSIRDNQIYCPICRCPEFSPNELRSSHFEPCSVGEMCERLLVLYPRPEVTVKWRK